jgi:hypothetical protein
MASGHVSQEEQFTGESRFPVQAGVSSAIIAMYPGQGASLAAFLQPATLQ